MPVVLPFRGLRSPWVTQSERRGLKARATHTVKGGRAQEGGHFRLESQEMVPEEGAFEPGLVGWGHLSQVAVRVERTGNWRRKLLRLMQKAGSQQARPASAAREGL